MQRFTRSAGGVAALVALAALLFGMSRRVLNRPRRVARALIVDPEEHTVFDPEDGDVRSVQAADLALPQEALDQLWDARHLERLAATYWRFLTRMTLGLVRVRYRPHCRDVMLLGIIPLLTFQEPEYELDRDRGIVRWRIARGFLVAERGRNGVGYLEIDVQRRESSDYPGEAIAHVEVEVSNFYPMIASKLSRWLYMNTQSRIHVILTHGFLRSLARLDLSESSVGRFARMDDLPDPVPARETVRGRGRPSAAAASSGRDAPTPAAPSPNGSA